MYDKFPLKIILQSFLIISFVNQFAIGQLSTVRDNTLTKEQSKAPVEFGIYNPDHLEDISPAHYTVRDWREIIDSTWGAGLPTSEKLAIFDAAWDYLDQGYGAFMNIYSNMDSLKLLYRPEIEAGVSRGRFAAIMNYLAFALKDAHTLIEDLPVNAFTAPQPGIPLFISGACVDISYFGAGLTPLPDSSLLVYKSVPNHTLGLQPGDIVLGYDGVPWKQLYKQLLEAQLPLRHSQVGSNDDSEVHILLQSAGLNWHLFEVIDIIKYSTGDTVHLPTSLLLNQSGEIWGNEQMPIPGVEFPDVYNDDFVSWGIVEGTTIGYIYVWSWMVHLDVSEQFYDAVYNLMYNYETTGIIVDFRVNYGGDMRIAHDGYSLLFNETLEIVGFDVRGDPNNHLHMIPSTTHPRYLWRIIADPASFYDKPIAVLTGPNAFSNGDWESVRMQYHPMVRTFGKSTNGAFTISDMPDLGNSDFFFSRATGSGYIIEGHEYMAHKSANIDEEIWLTQEDVVNGDDTVVKRAMEWINNNTSVESGKSDQLSDYYLGNNYPNPFNPTTRISYSIPQSGFITLKVFDLLGNEVAVLVNEDKPAGEYQVEFEASELTSGIYFYWLKAENFMECKKMVFIK
ncbi:S41 family peptidase [Bacteroidota bacterium]